MRTLYDVGEITVSEMFLAVTAFHRACNTILRARSEIGTRTGSENG